jgi:arylsulfatase A-like enzyme
MFRVVFLMLFYSCAAAAELQPNIIFILADDFGYGELSCYGGQTPTPNIDRIAREGIRFTQAYSASPICSPSRCGLITGQHPARWRITSYLQTRKGNRECEQADFLDPKAPSLPQALKNGGYLTAHIGKWHLGGGRDVTNAPPFSAYGYDVGLGTYESPAPHPDITATNWIWSPQDKVKRWERTRWFVNRTLDFLHEHPDKPHFVNLWIDDTHTPWVPASAASDPNRKDTPKNLREVIVEMDRQIGRLMESIRATKTDRSTLVIFVSDNGPLPTFQQSRTAGLRGAKLSLYEGGIRVPFIAWWPGKIAAGQVNQETVLSNLDMFPTLLHIAEIKSPAGLLLDGEDMSGAFLGKNPIRATPLFYEYGRNKTSFAYPGDPRNISPNVALRDGDWKLLLRDDGSQPELYNIKIDSKETKNLAETEPARLDRMRRAALAWRKAMP